MQSNMVKLSIMLLKLTQYLTIKQYSTNILINMNYEKLLIIKLQITSLIKLTKYIIN